MMLTAAQRTTLRTTIQGDGTAAPLLSAGNLEAVASYYNTTATPDFWVWRTRVTRDELVGTVSVDGTSFAWTGAGFLTRTQGERDAFNTIFDASGGANPSVGSVRQVFTDAFSGSTAPAPANRTHLLTICRRRASRLEKVFATGTGSTASPAVMGAEGPLLWTELVGL